MYTEDGTLFYNAKGVAAVRAFDGNHLRFIRCKGMRADSTLELTFATIIIVDVFMGGTTTRADGVFRNIIFGTFPDNRFYSFVVAFMEVFDEFLIVELFAFDNYWGFVYFEFLVLRRVGVVESPLLERYVFADK